MTIQMGEKSLATISENLVRLENNFHDTLQYICKLFEKGIYVIGQNQVAH